MPYADNNGIRIHWEERGEGSPLLLVMGHTFSSAMWYAAIDELSRDHRVLTVDNRGTGKSSTTRRFSVGDMARDAFAVLDAAGVDSAHLYGISMGGGIVIEMARQQPERVRSLVLGATLAKTPDVPGLPLLLRPLLLLPAPLLHKLLTSKRGAQNPHPYGTLAPADKVAQDVARIPSARTDAWTAVAQSKAIARYSITAQEVAAFSMPTLVLHGDEDALVPYEAGVTLHGLIAHSEMVTFPGTGHNYFPAAGDEANAAVNDFLRRVDHDTVPLLQARPISPV